MKQWYFNITREVLNFADWSVTDEVMLTGGSVGLCLSFIVWVCLFKTYESYVKSIFTFFIFAVIGWGIGSCGLILTSFTLILIWPFLPFFIGASLVWLVLNNIFNKRTDND